MGPFYLKGRLKHVLKSDMGLYPKCKGLGTVQVWIWANIKGVMRWGWMPIRVTFRLGYNRMGLTL